jgi:sugar lactone lactonase YvrE
MRIFSRAYWRPVGAMVLLSVLIVGAGTRAVHAHAAQPDRGATSPAATRFNTPYGITLDASGNVYVVDSSADQVIKLSKTGKVLERFGKKGHGPGQFDQPEQVAVDRQGIIYISDYGDDRVERFSPGGKFLGQWGKKGSSTLFAVHGVAAGPDNNIYMGTTDGVVKYSTSGKHLATYSVANVGFVHGVTLDHQGNIYTSDWDGHVTKLSPRGKMLVQWHNNKKSLGGTNFAEEVAVDSHGTVYVADNGFDRVDRFTRSLRPEGLLGKADGGDPGQFSGPNGIAVGPDGDIYVADSNNSRVQKLSPSGKVLAIWT